MNVELTKGEQALVCLRQIELTKGERGLVCLRQIERPILNERKRERVRGFKGSSENIKNKNWIPDQAA